MTVNYDALRTNLNGLAQACHEIAAEKGWWYNNRHFPEVIALIHSEASEALEAWREAKDLPFEWEYSYHFPDATHTIRRNSSGEPAEILVGQKIVHGISGSPYDSWVEDDWRPLTPEIAKELGGEAKPVGVPSEMADIIIRVLDACAAFGIDIERAVREKIEYNKDRPYRHGGKRA